jgi:hypothetical protein
MNDDGVRLQEGRRRSHLKPCSEQVMVSSGDGGKREGMSWHVPESPEKDLASASIGEQDDIGYGIS